MEGRVWDPSSLWYGVALDLFKDTPFNANYVFLLLHQNFQSGVSILGLDDSLATAIHSSSVHNRADKTRNLASPWARHVENDPRLLLSAALTRLCGSRIAGAVGLAKKC